MTHLRDTTIFSKTALCAYLMVLHKFLDLPYSSNNLLLLSGRVGSLKYLVLDCPNIILMSS